MFKIPISVIESQLECKVIRNIKVLGSDTASRTGICLIDTDEKFATFSYTFLKFDTSNKKIFFREFFEAIEPLIKGRDKVIIEDIFVGFNVHSALFLARLGGLVLAKSLTHQADYEIISAISARSKLGIKLGKMKRGESKEYVQKFLKNRLKIEIADVDIADSIVLALLGIIENIDYKPKEKKKKRSK